VLLFQNDSNETEIIKSALTRSGFDVAGPFSGVQAVNEYIAADQPDLAILDTASADGAAFRVARELQARGIPFVFYSEGEDIESVSPEFRESAFLERPVAPTLLTRVVGRIIDQPTTKPRDAGRGRG
jgi:DNA-binding NtrC family response regulator